MKICDICKGVNAGYDEVIRMKDDKETFEIRGHSQCIDPLYEKIRNVKNAEKKSVEKTLKEIGYNRSE